MGDLGETIRVLICRNCRTVEVLPDHDGPPETDNTLRWAADPHNAQDHLGNLVSIPASAWADPDTRKQIMSALIGTDKTGLPDEVYETKSNAMDDAMTCWRRHMRPADGCPDYWSDAKIMKPDTAGLRKELGIQKRDADPDKEIHLCAFCPVHVKVMERKKALYGLYK